MVFMGIVSLSESKFQGPYLMQLCAKYYKDPALFPGLPYPVTCSKQKQFLCSTSESQGRPGHEANMNYQCRKIKEAASLKVNGLLYSCLLITHLPSRYIVTFGTQHSADY